LSLAALATLSPAVDADGDRTKSSGDSINGYQGAHSMNKVSTKDGVDIFYKDWGSGQPIVFSHGWPLSSDDWDPQMMFFLNHGFRVIAHDRRGHGRSTQTAAGHDMDHYADDLAVLTEHLNLKNAVHVGWWRQGMMGGAKAHYDGIVAFSQTDFTPDMKKVSVPTLVMHGDDDQIVPYADSGPLSAKLLKNGILKTYKGFPHGMLTTQAGTINADILAFMKS
jgi:pimeloyl-ACP methyl ester carboxylesterase